MGEDSIQHFLLDRGADFRLRQGALNFIATHGPGGGTDLNHPLLIQPIQVGTQVLVIQHNPLGKGQG